MNGQEVVEAWMSLLGEFDSCFTSPGWHRFRQLAAGALLCERRPLVSEIITALGLESQWRSVEAFLERGAWPLGQVEDVIARTAAAGARCGGGRRRRRIWALDDLKVLKSGKKIWGACSFHEYTSRSPNRPSGGLGAQLGPVRRAEAWAQEGLSACGRPPLREKGSDARGREVSHQTPAGRRDAQALRKEHPGA